jgi:hypothetical protein
MTLPKRQKIPPVFLRIKAGHVRDRRDAEMKEVPRRREVKLCRHFAVGTVRPLMLR